MDTRVVQRRIRESLRRPPVVRSCSSRPAGRKDSASAPVFTDAAGTPAELWVTSFVDLLAPAPEPKDGEAADQLPIDEPDAAAVDQTDSQPDEADTDAAAEMHGADAAGDTATRLPSVLTDLGLDEALTDTLTGLAEACATVATVDKQPSVVARGQALLGSVETLTATAGRLDAVLLSATRQLTGVTAQVLLLDKGITSPDELSATAWEKWRAYAKRAVRKEMEALMGWGPGEISDLVAVANLPVAVTAPINHSLLTGESTWRLVRRFYRACSTFSTEDAAAVANAFFGDDPKASVTERLDSASEWLGGPWRHPEFNRALDREVNKIKSRDPETTKKTREDNLAANDTRVMVEDNGTAQIMIGCTATQGAAIADRIDKAARAARKAGDTRPLCQLRTATGTALLLHGTADLTGLPDDPDLITIEQSEQLTKILHGLPSAQLNVIVPLNTLIGTTPGGLTPVDADGKPIPAAFAAPGTAGQSTTGKPGTSASNSCTCECTCGAVPAATDPGAADPGGAGPTDRAPNDGSTGQDCPPPAQKAPPGADPGAPTGEPDGEVGVAEIIGKHSVFLTPDEVRTLALTPGSTMYRLLTDPATGVLVERSITAYPFDRGMRAHIIAADVFCRMPGCLKPASMAQIDHVQEHGTPGGHTCIANGQPLDTPDHDLKTKKLWDAVIHANRDVTWTTLLGRIYTTKAHDYRQYTKLLTAATTGVDEAITAGTDPAAAVDAAVYQALSYRPAGATLEAEDDDDWSELFTGWHSITLTHTPANGRRTYHPNPEAIRTEMQRHHDTNDRIPDDERASTAGPGQEDQADRGQEGQATGQQPDDDGPTSLWTHDPDTPPPF